MLRINGKVMLLSATANEYLAVTISSVGITTLEEMLTNIKKLTQKI